MIWQTARLVFQVPRARLTFTALSGATLVSVAVIGPESAVANGWLAAPFLLRVPENVSVVVGAVGGVGAVGVSLLHAAASSTTAKVSGTRNIDRNIYAP